MKKGLVGFLPAVISLVIFMVPYSVLSKERPIVAVFDVDGKDAGLSDKLCSSLSDYLAAKLTESGIFQVIPRSEIKQRLTDEKQGSYKECYEQSCQIELGRELAAQKTLASQVLKLGSRCDVTLTFYDLKKSTADAAATGSGKCGEDEIIATLDAALARLLGKRKPVTKKTVKENVLPDYEVMQPGTNLVWERCPLGKTWNGSKCAGRSKAMVWDKAMKACPAGYRLPTKQEFVNLLGGCDGKVKQGRGGYCSSCTKSKACSSMFEKDEGYYWTSSSYAYGTDNIWVVALSVGALYGYGEDSTYDARCVRPGP